MITKKQIISLTIVPVAVLCILDLASTYLGVCVFGGMEMNVNAIRLVQKFGFLPGGVIYMMGQLAMVSLIGWFLWKSREDDLGRTFVTVMLVLFLTDFANTVVLNFNTLMYQNTGKSFAPPDANQKDITPIQQEQIIQTFEPNKFCRLI
jgi:hypothetical protein